MKRTTPKKRFTLFSKISKSTKIYILCGLGAILFILALVLLYALINKIDIIAWFSSKYAILIYLGLGIYVTVGITLYVKDRIARM